MPNDARPTSGPHDTPDTEARESLLATFALGTATDTETGAATRLIAADPEAAVLAAEFAALAGLLPAAFADLEPLDVFPNRDLKARVLREAASSTPHASHEAPVARPMRIPVPVAPVVSSRRGRRAGFRMVAGWATAAVLAATSLGLWSANLGLRREAAPAQTAVSYAARSTHTYAMRGTADAPAANAVLLESPAEGGRVVLLSSGFPANPAGEVYRVWLQHTDGSYAVAGQFTADQSGNATLVLPGSLTGVQAVTITAEPQTAPAATPTGRTVMTGPLTA